MLVVIFKKKSNRNKLKLLKQILFWRQGDYEENRVVQHSDSDVNITLPRHRRRLSKLNSVAPTSSSSKSSQNSPQMWVNDIEQSPEKDEIHKATNKAIYNEMHI